MEVNEQYFRWPEVHLEHFYGYFILAFIIAGYIVVRSRSRHKFELFFLSFYLLTGNINKLLTFELPGLSFFKIQPIRFIFILLTIFIIRHTLLSRKKISWQIPKKFAWFQLALISYVFFLSLSVLVNAEAIGIVEVLESIVDSVAFLIIISSIGLMRDKASYDLIGRAMIIGGVFTTIISLIQLMVDPYFLRIGDNRAAFAGLLRSNGIFDTEYFNAYYLIIAICWVLISVKHRMAKTVLVLLFIVGVISSFQRMSWIILTLVLLTYLIYVKRMEYGKLAFLGISIITVVLAISAFNYRQIMNSSLVKERLTNTIDGRKGYYAMVIDNIGKKPLFGYGDLKNEVYYTNMLRITRDRDRASAKTGDLHSGYFSALFLYGIPAFISFTLFVFLSIRYYSKAYRQDIYFVIPLLVSIIYAVGNLTNTFLFLKYIAVLYAIHIGIGMGINKLKEEQTAQ